MHDSFRAYFCAEALLAQRDVLQADLAADHYEDVVRFLHDFLAGVTIHTADDLLWQIQVGWAYALQLHERHDPTSLQVIEHVQHLLETHAALLHRQPVEAQRWQREIRRQRGRSLYKFLGDFRGALETYALNYQERQEVGDELGQIRELNAAAKVFHDTYDFPAALVLLGHCLAYWEQALQAPDLSPEATKVLKDGLAVSLGAMGETLLKLWDIEGAMSCLTQNRALMADVAGDVARADIRLADCYTELALRTQGPEQADYFARAERYLPQAEDQYQGREYVLGFVYKQWLKLWVAQQRWTDAVTLTAQCSLQATVGDVHGYLLFYHGQALVAMGDHRTAREAFASSAIAFLHEHYTMEAAGVHLTRAATAMATGDDGALHIRQALELIQDFGQQYATLREQYFSEEIQQWLPGSLTRLEQRFPGLRQYLAGAYASAQAFFAFLQAECEQIMAIIEGNVSAFDEVMVTCQFAQMCRLLVSQPCSST